jgi:hypothetical protein
MADIERLRGLNKIHECLLCGTPLSCGFPGPDHYLPRIMLRRPNVEEHPFEKVISQRANKFRFCWDHHQEIDKGKIEAFCGPDGNQINPVALIDFLRRYYPMTSNSRYFETQKAFIAYTIGGYIEVAKFLNGELPKPVVQSYRDSIENGKDLLGMLQSLRCRAPRYYYYPQACNR